MQISYLTRFRTSVGTERDRGVEEGVKGPPKHRDPARLFRGMPP